MFPLSGLSGCDDILARFISTYTPLRFVSLIETSGKLHLITTCNRYQQYPDAFTMENHKELDFNPEEHVLYLNTDDSEDGEIENESDEIFDYLPDSQYTERVTDLYSDSLDPRSLAINREEFDKEFFRHLGQEKNDQNEKVLAWNRTPSIVKSTNPQLSACPQQRMLLVILLKPSLEVL
jgi:hypothetical protein